MAIIQYQIIVLVLTLHFYLPDPLLPLQTVLPYALTLAVDCPSAHSCPMQGYGRHQRHSTASVQGRGGCRDQSINVDEPVEDKGGKPAVPGPLDVASLLGEDCYFSWFSFNIH